MKLPGSIVARILLFGLALLLIAALTFYQALTGRHRSVISVIEQSCKVGANGPRCIRALKDIGFLKRVYTENEPDIQFQLTDAKPGLNAIELVKMKLEIKNTEVTVSEYKVITELL